MPFTTFHLIAGTSVKSVAPKYFSFSAFALTNVLIDSEVLYYLFTTGIPLHKFFHTFFGPDIFPSTFFGKGKEIYMKIYLFALPRRSPMPECPMHTDLPPMMSLLIGLPSSTIIP